MSSRAWQIRPYMGFSLTSPAERQAWHDEWRRNGGNCVEIGTFCGVSGCQAAALFPESTLFSIDTFTGNFCRHLTADTYAINRLPNMRLWVGTSEQMASEVGWPKDVRTVWVDGNHDHDPVLVDVKVCLANMTHGSILFHDYACACFKDTVKKVCDEYMPAHGWEQIKVVDTVAVYRKEPAK